MGLNIPEQHRTLFFYITFTMFSSAPGTKVVVHNVKVTIQG